MDPVDPVDCEELEQRAGFCIILWHGEAKLAAWEQLEAGSALTSHCNDCGCGRWVGEGVVTHLDNLCIDHWLSVVIICLDTQISERDRVQ